MDWFREKRLLELLAEAEKLAVTRADGHVTIMRFTTEWKVMLGTPELTADLNKDYEVVGGGRAEVEQLTGFESLEAALEHFTKQPIPPDQNEATA